MMANNQTIVNQQGTQTQRPARVRDGIGGPERHGSIPPCATAL